MDEMVDPNPSITDASDWSYSIEEVAGIFRVSPRTVYRWVKKGSLKSVQVVQAGGHRIPKEEVDQRIGIRRY